MKDFSVVLANDAGKFHADIVEAADRLRNATDGAMAQLGFATSHFSFVHPVEADGAKSLMDGFAVDNSGNISSIVEVALDYIHDQSRRSVRIQVPLRLYRANDGWTIKLGDDKYSFSADVHAMADIIAKWLATTLRQRMPAAVISGL